MLTSGRNHKITGTTSHPYKHKNWNSISTTAGSTGPKKSVVNFIIDSD